MTKLSDNLYAIACGEEGIRIVDADGNAAFELVTEYSVRDIQCRQGILYTAESQGGLGIYRYENGELKALGRYIEQNRYNTCFSSIGITESGNYIIAQSGFGSVAIVDVKDPSNPQRFELEGDFETGSMYYRNICSGLLEDGSAGVYGRKAILWLRENGAALEKSGIMDEILPSECQGVAAVWNGYIVTSTNGYRFVDSETGTVSKNYKIDGLYGNGKCCVSGDLLAVSRNYDGRLSLVDIADIKTPRRIATVDLGDAIDLACIDDDVILVPCLYHGLVKLEKN